MNSDIIQIYEINLQKNYDLLDSQIAKSQIYEEEYIDSIIDSMDNLLSTITKSTKDYIIALTLNDKGNHIYNNYSLKIKKAEKNLKEYQKKIKDIKANHIKNKNEKKEIIPNYNKNDMIQKVEYDSFNKMNHAIRVSTEIENMCGNILVDLNGQTNIMKNSVKKVGELNTDLDTSKGYLNKMIDKEKNDKKIIVLVGFSLLMIILLTLIYKIYQKFNFQR